MKKDLCGSSWFTDAKKLGGKSEPWPEDNAPRNVGFRVLQAREYPRTSGGGFLNKHTQLGRLGRTYPEGKFGDTGFRVLKGAE